MNLVELINRTIKTTFAVKMYIAKLTNPVTMFINKHFKKIELGNELNSVQVLRAVNAARATGATDAMGKYYPPVDPIKWDTKLEAVGYDRSLDMARRRYMDHITPDGDMAIVGYVVPYKYVGECIGAATPSQMADVWMWLQSPSHIGLVMGETWTHIGYGSCTGGVYGRYSALTFGSNTPVEDVCEKPYVISDLYKCD